MQIDFSKTKEQIKSEIVLSMCYTNRHDYGLDKTGETFLCGMTEQERSFLKSQMSALYDHHIGPLVEQLFNLNKQNS